MNSDNYKKSISARDKIVPPLIRAIDKLFFYFCDLHWKIHKDKGASWLQNNFVLNQ